MKFLVRSTASKTPFTASWSADGITIVQAPVVQGSGLICELEKWALILCFQLKGRTILGKQILRPREFTIWKEGSTKFRSSGNSDRILIALSGKQMSKWGMGPSFFQGMNEKELFMDVHLESDLAELTSCDFDEINKGIFIEGKVLQLIARMRSVALKHHTRKHIRSEYDLERILFARDHLVQNLAMPPGIPQLARVSGVNELKLKMGFREVFNNTVYGYLSDIRMEKAKNELSGKKTLTEIAFELGFSSNQHFSMAFKKKFGVAPSRMRK